MDYGKEEEIGSVIDSDTDNSSVKGGESDIDDVLSEFSGGEGSEMDEYENMEEEKDTDEYKTVEATPYEMESDEEEEDEDDEDDDYLQKLDDQFRQKVIENHHPELKTLNYEEIEMLATVVRDADSTIIDPLHRTLPVLTRYEKARVLGERAKQINMGAKPFVEVDESMIDGYLIALKELEQKAIPFIIQRPLPNGGSEYWRIADLEVLA
jgi:DNA-directed RNA polymerase I, II, and III subunit RPABC2